MFISADVAVRYLGATFVATGKQVGMRRKLAYERIYSCLHFRAE